jgi:predicted Zn-dependent peptidase
MKFKNAALLLPALILGPLMLQLTGLPCASAQPGTKSKPAASTKNSNGKNAMVFPVPKPVVDEPLDRSRKPLPQPAPEIRWADAERWELENGLRVFLVPNRKLPRISLSLVWDYDPVLEGSKSGVSNITGELIKCGTVAKSKAEFDEAVDRLGLTLSTTATSVNASALSRNAEAVFALTGEMLTQPLYRASELERLIKQNLSGLETEKSNAESIAERVLGKILYGAQHPYGEIMTSGGLESITLTDCEQFRDQYLRPNCAYLAIVGDIDRESAEKLTRQYWSSWTRQEIPAHKYALPSKQQGVRLVVVDRPEAVQTVIRIANTVQLYPGSPDVIPSLVMNTILGASDARLFDNLRETHGYTYGAYSSLSKNPLVGQFRAYSQVRNAVTDSALREFFYELNRIRDTLVPIEELQGVLNYLNGTFSISLQSPQTIAGFYIDQERYKMSPSYYRNYLQELAGVDAAKVREMANKMIQPGNCVVICVGKGNEIAPKLKALDSDGQIEWFDWNGEKAEDPTAIKLPANITLVSVLDQYVQATGGAKAWSKVKSMQTLMSATLQGMNLDLVETKRTKPLASLTTVKLNGSMVMSSDLYKDGKLSRKGMQGERPVDAEETAQQAMDALPCPELEWISQANGKLKLGGAAILNKELCARLDWTYLNGNTESHFYSLSTGLKVQSVRNSKGPDGKDYSNTTTYSDYRNIGKGLLIPHKVSISMGPQQIEFQVKEGKLDPRLKDSDFQH